MQLRTGGRWGEEEKRWATDVSSGLIFKKKERTESLFFEASPSRENYLRAPGDF